MSAEPGLEVLPSLTLAPSDLIVTYARSGGPGGQNVNKVASAIHLRFDITASSLPDLYKERLLKLSDHRITADGLILLQTTEVSDAELIPKLTAIAAERTTDKVFLRADGALAYERVAQVMGALNAGGFNNIGLVTDSGGPAMDGSN